MIEVKALYQKFEDNVILHNISLKIVEGDFLAVIGHNGSGKTTLIKHLNGLLLPSKGKVIVDNLDTKKSSVEIKKKVGMIFQNPEDQLVYSIVEEDIAFGLENLGLPPAQIRDKVDAILKQLHISKLAKENVNNLSFGQKQLVALAGILVMEPKYVVFDEPTTVLDPVNRENLFKVMQQVNRRGATVILVTNNLGDLKFVKRVIVLNKGKKIFDGAKPSKRTLEKADIYA